MSVLAVTSHSNTSNTTSAQAYPSITERVRRALVLAGTLGVVIGGAIGILQTNPELVLPPLSVEVAPTSVALGGMFLIGLICGAVTSLILRGTTIALRLVVSLFVVLVGLVTSELMQGALLGLAPHDSLTTVNDALEAGQLGLGLLGAAMGTRAGHRSRVQLGPSIPAQLTANRRQLPHRHLQRSESVLIGRMPNRTDIVVDGSRVKIAPTPIERQSQRWQVWRRRQGIHLGKEVISVCPYCLEEVKPNDPRGRVVCDICGTPHHGDCWSIAGKCEVPHLQT